jgi:hypothetical protein
MCHFVGLLYMQELCGQGRLMTRSTSSPPPFLVLISLSHILCHDDYFATVFVAALQELCGECRFMTRPF